MKIGLPIYWVEEHQVWSLLGENMFGLDETRASPVVVFQEVIDTCGDFLAPPELADIPFDEFLARVEAFRQEDCAEAAERRRWIRCLWKSSPITVMAAVCNLREEDPPEGSCMADADCGPGQACVDGWCR